MAVDNAGNLPALPGIFSDYAAPIVRNSATGRELPMVRWGMPSPAFALVGKKADGGLTNVRNTKLSHWRRWLGTEKLNVLSLSSACRLSIPVHSHKSCSDSVPDLCTDKA